MELREFLNWVISGGGAGVIAYWLLGRWGWFARQTAEIKRYVAIAATFILADIFWLAAVCAGYSQAPADTLGLIEQLFLTGTTAFGLSQVIHGARDLHVAGDK